MFIRYLRHLDISNCCLQPRHATPVAEAINQNHFISGLHYDGNAGMADPKGFVHINEDQVGRLHAPHRLRHALMRRIIRMRVQAAGWHMAECHC
jgi:hypothetical protein